MEPWPSAWDLAPQSLYWAESAQDCRLPGTSPRRDELLLLAELADLTLAASREHLKAVECARALQGGGSREDLQDFLEAVDQVVILEHRSDDVNRRAKRSILTSSSDLVKA